MAREQEEAARRAEEAKRREAERLQREIAEEEEAEVRKLIKEHGISVKDGVVLNKRKLQQQEFERKTKEQAEFEVKMNKLARNMDHMERARREEEVALLEKLMAERLEAHRQYFDREQEALLARHRANWERDLPAKHATARMAEDRCASSAVRAIRLDTDCFFGALEFRIEGFWIDEGRQCVEILLDVPVWHPHWGARATWRCTLMPDRLPTSPDSM
jgi:hypothetical protein